MVTEPTKQATQRTPATIAEKLYGGALGSGQEIGFRHGDLNAFDRRNQLVFVTDGTLINWISDGQLARIGTVMIDEAHKRSLNIELCLGLLKRELPKHPHLKLIIASATIDAERFEAAFSETCGVTHVRFSGTKQYGYAQHFAPEGVDLGNRDAVHEAVLRTVTSILENPSYTHGDILAFMATVAGIESAVVDCRQRVARAGLADCVTVLPLHGRLAPAQQRDALDPAEPGRRKVVLATTIAETSLSVKGIVHVVDSGLVLHPTWDPVSETTDARPHPHSQAGCRQRWGRAGRMEAGHAHCIYTREQFESFELYTSAEIERNKIDDLVLKAKSAGVGRLDEFPWLTAPKQDELTRAERVLREAGALDGEGDLTEHGLELQSFAMSPTLVNLLLNADQLACAVEMSVIVGFLLKSDQERDGHVLRVDRNWDAATHEAAARARIVLHAGCLDDVDLLLKVFEAWSTAPDRVAWAQRYFVRQDLLEAVDRERTKLLRELSGHKKDYDVRPVDFRLADKIRLILTHGFPSAVYHFEEGTTGQRRYVTMRESRAAADPAVNSSEQPADGAGALRNTELRFDYRSFCHDHVPHGRDVFVELPGGFAPPNSSIRFASLVAAIPKTWAGEVHGDALDLALAAARLLRVGDLAEDPRDRAVMLSLDFGLDDIVRCARSDEEADRVEVTALLRRKEPWVPTTVDGERPKTFVPAEDNMDDLAVPPSDVPIEVPADEDDWAVESAADEDDDLAMAEPLASGNAVGSVVAATGREVGVREECAPHVRGVLTTPAPEGSGVLALRVCGYDASRPDAPLLFAAPPARDPFDAFCERFLVGDELEVVVEELLQLPSPTQNPRKATFGLRVIEPLSGLTTIVEGSELSMAASATLGFALRVIKPGSRLRLHVFDIERDPGLRRVHLTAIEALRLDLAAMLGRRQLVEAVVRHVSAKPAALHVSLRSTGSVPQSHNGLVTLQEGDSERYELGQRVLVVARSSHRAELPLDQLPSGAEGLSSPALRVERERGLLVAHGPISLATRIELRRLFSEQRDRARIDRFCRDSLRLDLRLVDQEELRAFASSHPVGTVCQSEVAALFEGRGVVLVDGICALLDWYDTEQELSAGQALKVVLRTVQPDKGRIVVEPVHASGGHPIDQCSVNQIVSATVTSKVDHGVYFYVRPGVEGRIPAEKLGPGGFDGYRVGGRRVLQIRHVDRERRRLSLCPTPEAGAILSLDVDRITSSGSRGVVVRDPETGFSGFLAAHHLSWQKVVDPSHVVSAGQRLRVLVAAVDLDAGRVHLTCRLPESDPFDDLAVGDHTECVVVGVERHRALVRTSSGLVATLGSKDVGWTNCSDLRQVLLPDEVIPRAEIAAVDRDKRTVALSLSLPEDHPSRACPEGAVVVGRVVGSAAFGIFVALPGHNIGLVHVKNLGRGYVPDATDIIKHGEPVRVRVSHIEGEARRIQLSMAGVEQP